MAHGGYDNEDVRGYGDYYEGEGQGYEEEGGEEYEEEEEEPRKPTKEELVYLELRQKLKESIRKKMKKESSSSTSCPDSADRKKNKLPYDNYGSFFGPSQPVIAQRVIQESKSLFENRHFASGISNPLDIKKNKNKVSNGGSKSSPPKVYEMKVKAQKLKDSRDYSFRLSDDAELPAPSKVPPPQNMSVRNSGRPGQVTVRNKPPLSNGGKHVHGSLEGRKLGSVAGHLPPKSGSSYKLSSTSKPSIASAHSRKLLGNNGGNGPGWPVGAKDLSSKMSVSVTGNKSGKDLREPNKPKMISKQPVASSKPQINKPLKQNSVHMALQDRRPMNKVGKRHFDDVEDKKYISIMIRSMFKNYDPKKFVNDDDDDNMEAGFDEILREERRSAKIAKMEDEEQLRLIEEEEERERRRRLAKLKKRKLCEY
ncbi:protein spt2-like [Gastrolobium bilobum]|uniref:protein spt2-like n=1 Tax=Gastrolobium bilobum TaxID=150636 RepID=UPI002AAF58D1|nr:protein spt2-like [Gastrolobium bilobum]